MKDLFYRNEQYDTRLEHRPNDTGENELIEKDASVETRLDELKSREFSDKRKYYYKHKPLFVIILAECLLIAMVIFMLQISTDKMFVRSTINGLRDGWSLNSGEVELQLRNSENKSTKFIDIEYDAVGKYKDKVFRDMSLAALADSYIEALEECKAVSEKYDPNENFDAFWQEFSPCYAKRISALYDIYTGGYGLKEELKYETDGEQFRNLILNGWAIKKVAEIEFKRMENDEGNVYYSADVLNDSGLDLLYFNLDVGLIDKEGDAVETAAAYVENWQNGTEKELTFYCSNIDAVGYKIISESSEIDTGNAEGETDGE